jgi:hypothetical protein
MVKGTALLVSALVVIAVGCAQTAVPRGSAPPGSLSFPTASSPPTSIPLQSETPAPTPQPIAVVSIETRGGECASGSCNRLVNIDGDGTLHEVIPKDAVLGTVPKELLDALRLQVEQADYRSLRSKPLTGVCPTAVDGQETIYTFHATAGDQQLASCKVAIDPKHPLFQALAAAIAAAGGL